MSGGSLPIKKVYIDSRFKTKDSVSNSHFKYELVESLQLPDNTVCYVDDVIIPHSYFNISDNDTLYVRQFDDNLNSSNDKIIYLEHNNHNISSLLQDIQAKLNAAYGQDTITVTFDSRKLSLTFTESTGKEVKLFTDEELTQSSIYNIWEGPTFNNQQLRSANEVIGNYITRSPVTSFETGIVDLRRYHNIYILSPNLSSFSTLGPRGEGSIIKKIPVTTEYGFTIIDNVVAPHDWIDVSKLLLKTLEFRLSDAFGNTIDLRGSPISFSLIFMSQND